MTWRDYQIPNDAKLKTNAHHLIPRMFVDGSHTCVLFGNNLADGLAGFGISRLNAMRVWNKQWEALNMENDSELNIIALGPLFDRTDDIVPSREGLYSIAQFQALKDKSAEYLLSMGCQIWSVEDNKTLWLYPTEWYDIIPDGLEIADISGGVELFKKGETDDDRRVGALSFGFIQEK